MKTIDGKCRSAAWLCTAVYFASYIMRINFAVMIVKICSDMVLKKTDLSVVLMCLTIAYGTGQIISGVLGDKIKPTSLIFYGLVTAVACNIAMFFCQSVPAMAIVWCINGLAHALLWPPMVRILASNLSDEQYLYSVVRVSWGSSIATMLLYLVCPMLLLWMSWRVVILLCAVVGAIIALMWKLLCPKVFTGEISVSKDQKNKTVYPSVKMPGAIYLPLALIMLGIFCQGILRDGVTNWMPSYLHETFNLSEESAILTAVIPAVFSIIGFEVFGKLQQKWIHNEVLCAAAIFGISAVSSAVLYFVTGGSTSASTLLMSLIVGCMHGINLMLITVVPKRFVKYGRVSTISGILNAFTYVGASASTYGFAVLAESQGWKFTIGMWFVVAVAGLLACLVASFMWRKYSKS